MLKKFIFYLALCLPSISYAGQDILIPAGTYTTGQTSQNVVRGVEYKAHFVINVTAASGSFTPIIEAQDYVGNYYTLLQGLPITSTGITILKIGPGIGPIPNAATSDYLPDVYRIRVTQSGGSFTYGVTLNRGQ